MDQTQEQLIDALYLIAEHLQDISTELRDLNKKAVHMPMYHETRVSLLGGPAKWPDPSFKKFLQAN